MASFAEKFEKFNITIFRHASFGFVDSLITLTILRNKLLRTYIKKLDIRKNFFHFTHFYCYKFITLHYIIRFCINLNTVKNICYIIGICKREIRAIIIINIYYILRRLQNNSFVKSGFKLKFWIT